SRRPSIARSIAEICAIPGVMRPSSFAPAYSCWTLSSPTRTTTTSKPNTIRSTSFAMNSPFRIGRSRQGLRGHINPRAHVALFRRQVSAFPRVPRWFFLPCGHLLVCRPRPRESDWLCEPPECLHTAPPVPRLFSLPLYRVFHRSFCPCRTVLLLSCKDSARRRCPRRAGALLRVADGMGRKAVRDIIERRHRMARSSEQPFRKPAGPSSSMRFGVPAKEWRAILGEAQPSRKVDFSTYFGDAETPSQSERIKESSVKRTSPGNFTPTSPFISLPE